MHNVRTRLSLKDEQGGFASIVIALTVIVVLSLLTVGFAQLGRREQQNALNNQLSRQAYYAAETGINDVKKLYDQNLVSDSGNDCINFPAAGINTTDGQVIKSSINSNAGVSYSCAILKTKLPDLNVYPLEPDKAWTTSFRTDPTQPKLTSFVVRWFSTNPAGKTFRTYDSGFPPAANWNSPAVLQVSVTPLAQNDRTSQINNTFTAYLYPSSGGTPFADYSPGGPVKIVSGACIGGGCAVTFRNLQAHTGSAAGETFLVHIVAYYDSSDVSIDTGRSITNSSLNFEGSQALIDVTGRARDVLKRLQVRIPIDGTNSNMPSYGIEAQDVCKRFTTAPVTANNPNGTEFISPNSPFGVVNTGACVLN